MFLKNCKLYAGRMQSNGGCGGCPFLAQMNKYAFIPYNIIQYNKVGRDSSVHIATRYGFGGQGIETRWRRDFPHPPYRPWGPASLLCNGYWVSFPEVKQPGRCVNHPPPPGDKVKERLELYLYSSYGSSRPVLGQNLLFII